MKPSIHVNNFALLLTFMLIMSDIIPNHDKKPKSFVLPNLSQVTPFDRAYAHNDYEHSNPLTDALKLGFTFIEADVHLLKDSLYVSHYRPLFPNKEKTLSRLYLDPLFKLQQLNKGRIFPGQQKPLVLMVDIKTEAESTYQKIKEVLIPYQKMLCSWEALKEHTGAVKIIISGNRPIQTIQKEEIRYVQIDGRLKDIPHHYPAELMPIISDNYSKIFGFFFFEKMMFRNVRLKKLAALTKKIHAQDKIIRLWNSPENEKNWEQLIDCGVDLINTDKLKKLNTYLKTTPEHQQKITIK